MSHVQDIRIIEHLIFTNLSQKIYFWGYIFDFFSVTEFQNRGNKHDHGLLWIKNAPMYGMHTNEEIEKFVDMYIFCDVLSSPNLLQNAQQHQHTHTCKKKPCCFVDFITHCFLCV
jgi:hypothetical protein